MINEMQLKGKKIIIYGAGDYGNRLFNYLKQKEIETYAFCETNPQKKNFRGKKVVSLDYLKKNIEDYTILIAIANSKLSKQLTKNVLSINPTYNVYEMGKFIDCLSNSNNLDLRKKTINYRSLSDLSRLLRDNFSKVREYDCIVGVPRSGLIPATELGLLSNKPVVSLNEFLYTDYEKSLLKYTIRPTTYSSDRRKILIIDDSCGSGTRIRQVKDAVESRGFCGLEIDYACVYVTEESKRYVDLYFEICEFPRVFEWNIMNHSILSNSALDLDGVLCEDPTDDQNDDGDKYINFIKNATPKFIPLYEIGAIVTSRLEKYRKETVEWLKKNNIIYNQLIMLDLPDKESRIRFDAHASFKAETYLNSRYEIFFESDEEQAVKIRNATNKCVFCTDNMTMYEPLEDMDYYEKNLHNCKIVKKEKLDDINKLLELKRMQESHGFITNEASAEFVEMISRLHTIMQKLSLNNPRWETLAEIEKECNHDKKNAISLLKTLDIYEIDESIDIEVNKRMQKVLDRIDGGAWGEEQKYIISMLKNEILEKANENNPYQKEINYIKEENRLMLYPYSFEKRYDYKDVNVEYDDKEEMLYVLHNKKKLYFPYLDSEIVRRDYNLLIMEQDEESPQRYFDNNVCVNEGDIFVDVGAAEGIISLDVIERASEVFLIECSDKWRKALGRTFEEYKEKVHIIEKIAGLETDDTSIRIDSLLNKYKGKRIILKMDVEGMELDVLKGARNTLANNECFVTCATYHTEEAAKEIAEFFEKEGYTYNYSDGYMLFYYGYMTFFNGKYTRIKPPYFRRGIIRARKDTSGFEGKEKND